MKQDEVLQAFSDKERYEAQKSIYSTGSGPDAREECFRQLRDAAPKEILEVGCGMGEFATRILQELTPTPSLSAIDISPYMVELTKSKSKGAHALVADVTNLPFEIESFDCVVANWVLHYLEEPRLAIDECYRVLKPGGRLIVSTNGETHMGEIWEIIAGSPVNQISFSRENGSSLLGSRFKNIRSVDIDGTVVFEDRLSIEGFIGRHIGGEELVPLLPEVDTPFTASRKATVFIADKA
jgi:SAM-dependent methyltransferase